VAGTPGRVKLPLQSTPPPSHPTAHVEVADPVLGVQLTRHLAVTAQVIGHQHLYPPSLNPRWFLVNSILAEGLLFVSASHHIWDSLGCRGMRQLASSGSGALGMAIHLTIQGTAADSSKIYTEPPSRQGYFTPCLDLAPSVSSPTVTDTAIEMPRLALLQPIHAQRLADEQREQHDESDPAGRDGHRERVELPDDDACKGPDDDQHVGNVAPGQTDGRGY